MPGWLGVACYRFAAGAGTSRYTNPVGGSIAYRSTEADAQALARDAYTWSKLWFQVLSNTCSTASTVRSRKNTANGNQSVTVPALGTGNFSDDVNSDSLVNGDLFNWQVAIGGVDAESFAPWYLASRVVPTTNVGILLGSKETGTALVSAQTRYLNTAGAFTLNGTEALTQYTIRTASTFSRLRARVTANTLNGATTVRLRINGFYGNLILTIGAGLTGWFEDVVNSDAIAAGDALNYELVTGGAAGTMTLLAYHVRSASSVRQLINGLAQTVGLGFGTTFYGAIDSSSWNSAGDQTEANLAVPARLGFTTGNFFVRVTANTVTGNTTVRTRKNAANGNQSVTIPNSTTGAFEDNVNTDSFVAADTLNYQMVMGGAAGSITFGYIGVGLNQPAAGGMMGVLPVLMRGMGVS